MNGVRSFVLLATFALSLAAPVGIDAHTFTIDQSNVVGEQLHFCVTPQCMGQEFTPTLSSLDVVELTGVNFNETPASASVVIHQGTIDGPVLGTSGVVTVPAGYGEGEGAGLPVHFDFPTSVALVPGNLFVIEIVTSSGFFFAFDASDPYPGGRGFIACLPGDCLEDVLPLIDYRFAEGPASAPVPEPATLMLLLTGGIAALGVRRHRTRRSRRSQTRLARV